MRTSGCDLRFYAHFTRPAGTALLDSALFRAEVAMQLRHERPISAVIDWLGAACAYLIIVGMLATALAPLFTPLLER
jgi:hypothetical protein